jgi:hypothetical protein
MRSDGSLRLVTKSKERMIEGREKRPGALGGKEDDQGGEMGGRVDGSVWWIGFPARGTALGRAV